MGQVLGAIQEKFQGKQWKEKQIKKITNKVFDHFKDTSGKVNLTFEELYIAILLVYNDINKHLPGSHIDPPSRIQVKVLMETCDLNLDGELDRDEFVEFIKKLTADTLSVISQNMIIAMVAAPTLALVTKRATEGVPGVGKVVQKLPNAVYASIVTLAVVMLQKTGGEIE